MDLKGIMQNEKKSDSQSMYILYYSSYRMLKVVVENRLMVARGQGWKRM